MALALILSTSPLTMLLGQSENTPSFRFDVQLRVGIMREPFKTIDPAGGLNRRAYENPWGGGTFRYYKNPRTHLSLNYDRLTFGTTANLRDPRISPNKTTSENYSRISLLMGKTLTLQGRGISFRFLGQFGPALNINNVPKRYGIFSTGAQSLPSIPDWFVLDSSRENRGVFAGLQGVIGTEAAFKRFYLTTSLSYALNLGRKNVTINQVTYTTPGDPTVKQATLKTTGNAIQTTFGLGYRFGQRDKIKLTKAKKEELATARRFAVSFNMSWHLATIKTADPANHLTNYPYERFTYGARLHWEVKPNWILSTGFESFPNTVDARRKGRWGGDGIVFPNGHQIPVMVQRRLLRFRTVLPFELLVGGGVYFGFKPDRGLASSPPTYAVYTNPDYYEELERRFDVTNTWWNAAINAQLNMHLSGRVFLFGYCTKQFALTNRPLIQSNVSYRIDPAEQTWHKATLYTNGAVLQPGFGLGYRF